MNFFSICKDNLNDIFLILFNEKKIKYSKNLKKQKRLLFDGFNFCLTCKHFFHILYPKFLGILSFHRQRYQQHLKQKFSDNIISWIITKKLKKRTKFVIEEDNNVWLKYKFPIMIDSNRNVPKNRGFIKHASFIWKNRKPNFPISISFTVGGHIIQEILIYEKDIETFDNKIFIANPKFFFEYGNVYNQIYTCFQSEKFIIKEDQQEIDDCKIIVKINPAKIDCIDCSTFTVPIFLSIGIANSNRFVRNQALIYCSGMCVLRYIYI